MVNNLIEGKVVNLRALEFEDLHQLRDWRNSKFVRRGTREYRLLNMINQKKWFESLHSKNPPDDIMFGITNKKGKLIGVCGLTHINWKNRNTEASIYIGERNWQGKGAARDSLRVMLEYSFKELNLHKVWAEIYEFNDASVRLFENMHFMRDGMMRHTLWRDGKWWNSYLYSILEKEFQKTFGN